MFRFAKKDCYVRIARASPFRTSSTPLKENFLEKFPSPRRARQGDESRWHWRRGWGTRLRVDDDPCVYVCVEWWRKLLAHDAADDLELPVNVRHRVPVFPVPRRGLLSHVLPARHSGAWFRPARDHHCENAAALRQADRQCLRWVNCHESVHTRNCLGTLFWSWRSVFKVHQIDFTKQGIEKLMMYFVKALINAFARSIARNKQVEKLMIYFVKILW